MHQKMPKKSWVQNKEIEQELEIMPSDVTLLKEKEIIEPHFNFEDNVSCDSSLTVSPLNSDEKVNK